MDQKYAGEFQIENVNETLFSLTCAVEQNLYRGINYLLTAEKEFYTKCYVEILD